MRADTLVLEVDTKPVTGNHANKVSFKTGRVYSTKEKNLFFRDVEKAVVKARNFVSNAAKWVDLPLSLSITFFIPKEEFFTKKGIISKRSVDLDNLAKTSVDALFRMLDLDDKSIVDLTLRKIPAGNYKILYKLKVVAD